MSDKQKALLSTIIASFLAGAVAAVIKIGLTEIPPLTFSFLRFLLAAVCILPFLLRLKRDFLKDIIGLLPLSLLAGINIVLFIFGLKTTTATIGTLIYAGTPMIAGILAFYFLEEKLNIPRLAGIIIGFIGVGGVILLPLLEKGVPFSGDLTGNLLIGLGVILTSFYKVFSKRFQRNYSPLVIASMFIVTTTIALLPLSLFELQTQWWTALTGAGLLSIIYSGIFATAGMYIFQQYAIKHGGPVVASMQLYLQPILAFLSAFVILGERLTMGIIIGGVLSFLGIFLVSSK